MPIHHSGFYLARTLYQIKKHKKLYKKVFIFHFNTRMKKHKKVFQNVGGFSILLRKRDAELVCLPLFVRVMFGCCCAQHCHSPSSLSLSLCLSLSQFTSNHFAPRHQRILCFPASKEGILVLYSVGRCVQGCCVLLLWVGQWSPSWTNCINSFSLNGQGCLLCRHVPRS